jgi:heat shock protein HtpX
MPANFRELEKRNRRSTFFLIAVFIPLFAALGLGLDFLAGDLRFRDGTLIGFPFLTIAAMIFACIQTMVSYFGGTGLILLSVHARELTPATVKDQIVLDVINEMAIAARMPVPKAYVMDDPAPNAFATGRDPKHSVVCVTQGLIDQMDREELQGVLGHEMSHVADYDIRTMMMVAVLVGGIAMLSDFFFRWSFYGGMGRRSSRDNDSGNNNAGAIIAIAVIVLAILAPILSQLIAMAVSRQREYLADASSVEFTRNPRALLRALEHIAQVESPLKEGTRGTAHLFIVSPLADDRPGDADGTSRSMDAVRDKNSDGFFANLLSTHPPLNKRIERLRAMLGASAPADPVTNRA